MSQTERTPDQERPIPTDPWLRLIEYVLSLRRGEMKRVRAIEKLIREGK